MQAVPEIVHYVAAENAEHSSYVIKLAFASEHYLNRQFEAVPVVY